MDVADIIRRLVNSGIKVLGHDSVNIYIEDPGCILRGFETFLNYAWVIIGILAGFMLFVWAIALIRGARTDVARNLRNLVIIFAMVFLAKPIVNLVYQDDLFGRGCRTVAVPISGINVILDARNIAPSANDELFEEFDIYDSGVFGDLVEDGAEPPVSDDTGGTGGTGNTGGTGGGPRGPSGTTPPVADGTGAVSATEDGYDVIYNFAGGGRVRYTGGTRAWRNTNPGNLRNGTFARSMGAIGTAGRFAVFPTEEAGVAALRNLLLTDSYRNLSIYDAIARYAPSGENDVERYRQRLREFTGLDIRRRISDLSTEELDKVVYAIRRSEGWKPGRKVQM